MRIATSHSIRNRKKPNDIFITPLALAKKHIDMVKQYYNKQGKIWYDPFKNSGRYYNNFNEENKKWTEILQGKDFFEFNEEADCICSNCPYSMIDKVLEKSIELNPDIISYLLGIHNITPRRIEYMEKTGYYIKKLHLCKVHKWYGMSCIVIWAKEPNGIVCYDRTYYRE